jgi:hypothetical protein
MAVIRIPELSGTFFGWGEMVMCKVCLAGTRCICVTAQRVIGEAFSLGDPSRVGGIVAYSHWR